jgi:Flp pilus assembly protein TadG
MSRTCDRGQTLAEFALALPVFLLIVLGLFDVGRLVFVYNGLTNAVREGARLAVVNQDKDLIHQRAQDMAFGITIDTDATTMTSFYRQLPNSDDVTQNDPCDPADPAHPMAVGCIAVVQAESTWQAITPVIGNLLGPIDLTARSELAVEFECPNPSVPAYNGPAEDVCPKQP